MTGFSGRLLKHLSTVSFIIVYLITAISHIFLEGFLIEIQFNLITTMLPLMIFGLILDFIVQRNNSLLQQYKILAQILPIGLFILIFISMLLGTLERETPAYFDYLYWLFLSIPLFIVSYDKNMHKRNMINAVIGLGLVAFVYLFLTTHTDRLDEGSGIIVYFFTYFLMLYAASCIKRASFISILIGLANAAALLILRYYPISAEAKIYGWDYNIYNDFELILLSSLILCILVRFLAAIMDKGARLE